MISNENPNSPIIFEKQGEATCPIEFTDRSRAFCPVEFMERRQAISPIEFMERSQAVSPVIFEGTEGGQTVGKSKNSLADRTSGVKPEQATAQDKMSIVRAEEKAEENEDLTNYVIKPVEKRSYIDRDGKEIKAREEIVCNISIDNSRPQQFLILTREIRRLTTVIGERFSNAALNYNIKKADKIVENRFRDATKGIPVMKYYVDYGWQRIDGSMVYVHDSITVSSDKIFLTGMNLPYHKLTGEQVGQIFFDAYSLYAEKGPLSTMLAFSMLGVLYRLFEEAGYAPHFLLFINGKTGSMKTTLSKILFIQLTDEAHRDTPRRIDADTVVSFERGIVLGGRDTVTLIDDYAPAKTSRQKDNNEEKLERIIRMVGDRSTRSRSNTSLEDCRGEGVKGVVVLTGELTGKGLSSNLRCFYCGISRECVNESMVTRFQNEPYRYTTLIQNFALFISGSWTSIIDYIKGSFQQERELVGKRLSERRLIDSAGVLRITCEIIRKFLLQYCRRSHFEVDGMIDEMKSGVLMMAYASEAFSLEESLAVRFAKIIDQLLQSKRLNVLSKRPTEDDIAFIDGFFEADYYYFLPENLYGEIKKVFSASNMYLPLNMDEMVKTLFEEGIITPTPNGAGKRTYYARILMEKGRKRNFLKIKKQILQEIAER